MGPRRPGESVCGRLHEYDEGKGTREFGFLLLSRVLVLLMGHCRDITKERGPCLNKGD
jgi:hypothetical protein